jgi:transposase-like protein
MMKKNTEVVAASSPTWETLEAFARASMQQFLQRMLEEEVDELLARGRYERRPAVDAPAGYRNGSGKPRRLSLSNGTIALQRPRVRGLSERFESRLLPAFKRLATNRFHRLGGAQCRHLRQRHHRRGRSRDVRGAGHR